MSVKSRLRAIHLHWSVKEALASIKLALPIGLGLLLQQVVYTVSLAFVGHIDHESTIILEAVGLAISTIAVTGLCIGIGLCAAIETLASQAWGAKKYKKVGIYIQRAVLIIGLVVLLVYSFWFNIESLLHLVGQPPCVIDYTVQYIQVFSCCLPAMFLYAILQRYLQAQKIVYPFIIIGIIGNVVNALAHYFFLFVAKWGIRGAAGALALTWYTIAFSLLIIIYVRKLHVKTWGGWSRECLNDWGQFARFGIPGFIMLFAEWGAFELGFVLTGLVSKTEQTIYTLLTNWIFILFMLPLSISIATNVRIGNELGAGSPKKAKRALFVGLCIVAAWVVLISTVNFSLRSYILRLFTDSGEMIVLSSIPMVVLAVLCVADHIQTVLGGALRGLGKQAIGSCGNIAAFWVAGIPVGIGLLFGAKLGALGYAIGLAIASYCQLVAYSTIIIASDWKKQSEKARKIAGLKSSPPKEHATSDNVDSEDEIPLKPWSDSEDDSQDTSDFLTESSFDGNEALIAIESDMKHGMVDSECGVSMSHTNSTSPSPCLSRQLVENDNLTQVSEELVATESEVDSDPLVSSTTQGLEGEEPDHEQRRSSRIILTKKTILLRSLTVSAFVVLLICSIVLSQVYVYRPNVCEQTNATNMSANFSANVLFNATLLSL